MSLHLAPFQAFECHSCGRCCRNSWSVQVEEVALADIAGSETTQKKERQGYLPLVVVADGTTVTGRDTGGACLYLDGEGWCEIHAELGSEKKPLACQLFPYAVTATPDGLFASLSFACPVALWGHDGELERNRRELESLLESRGDRDRSLPHRVELVTGRSISWASYRSLEQRLVELPSTERPALSLLGLVGEVLLATASTGLDDDPSWETLTGAEAQDEFEVTLLQMLCASLIALLELPTEPQARQEMSQAILSGGRIESPRHGSVLPELSLYRTPNQLLQACLERYRQNALFGKGLLNGTVVSRLLLWATGFVLLDFYGELFEGLHLERKVAIARAFELVEAELLTHSRSADSLFAALEATWCQAYGVSVPNEDDDTP